MNKHNKELLEQIKKERMQTIPGDERKEPTDEEKRAAIAKEAPCYRSQILEKHEFAGGECICCGLPQPGNYKPREERSMDKMFSDE